MALGCQRFYLRLQVSCWYSGHLIPSIFGLRILRAGGFELTTSRMWVQPRVLLPCHSRLNLNLKIPPHKFKNLINEAPQEEWHLQGWPPQASAWDRVLSQFWHNQPFYGFPRGVEALSILQQIWILNFFRVPKLCKSGTSGSTSIEKK